MNNENKIKLELQRIYDVIQLMEYNEDNLLDLMNYMDKVVELIEPINTNNRYNGFLNQVFQTKTKELENLKHNFNNEEERKDYFDILKDNFLIDLIMWDM